MNNAEIMRMLSEFGAVITDSHIVYTSGRHGSAYINKDALYLHPQPTSVLCQMMARTYHADQIDVVVGPALGGIVLSQWVAYHLNTQRSSGETLSLYAEKEGIDANKHLFFSRGYDSYIPGKNVLVVEDILVTGGSALKVIELIRATGGNVLGLSVLCNRGGIRPEDMGGVPIHALANISMESWPEEECHLCQQGVPINTELGKGKAYLAAKKLRKGEA